MRPLIVVSSEQRRGPRPWAIALGLIAIAMIPVLAVAAMAGDRGSGSDCESVAQSDQALLTRAVLDVLPAGSVREVAKSSDYDDTCEIGGTELTARWSGVKGHTMVEDLEFAGWQRTAEGAPDWFANGEGPTGGGIATNDNDSPNMILTRIVDSREIDLAVDQEGLHAVVARDGVL